MWEDILSVPISVKSYAKITLYLDVVEPFDAGFWEIQSIVLPLDLHDLITIELKKESGIYVECNNPQVVTDESNTCYKAAQLALEQSGRFKGGLSISIDKRIPVSSGLGGGSSNAAIVLKILNSILNLGWDISKLAKMAHSISRDSYFFCYSKPAYVDGQANNLVPLPPYEGPLSCAIINPKIPFIHNKAGFVMRRVKSGAKKKRVLPQFIKPWIVRDAEGLQAFSYNFMTEDVVPEYKKAFDIKRNALSKLGLNLSFTGTGPFMMAPYSGSNVKGLEELCAEMDADISYARIVT